MTPQRLNDLTAGSAKPSSRMWHLGAAVLAAALLGGCGSVANQAGAPQTPPESAVPLPGSSPSSEPPGTATATSSAGGSEAAARPQPAQVERCHTSMLSGSVRRSESGAGQRYAELVLTNTSGEACTLYGYGGMELVGPDGKALPTDMQRSPNPGPAVVRLAPGESASSTLHWTVVPHEGEPVDGPCQPKPVSAKVTPPDERDPLTVRWDLGSVCGFGSIENSAYHG